MFNQSILSTGTHRGSPTRDRCVVYLLRRQRIQSRSNTHNIAQSHSIPASLRPLMDQVAMIVATIAGQVQFISQEAENLLAQYSLFCTSQELPDCLYQWFQHQIAQLSDNGHDPSLSSPLHLEQTGRQLMVRFLSGSFQGSYLLLLEERQLPSLSVADLELIGLTKREAEILFWVAKDKSNADIARLVNCREGTVRKHLENLHRKLGVQTRTAAVMAALERLGFLQA